MIGELEHRCESLETDGFTRIAAGGFGDGLNAYAHVMGWHEEALYVGTTRANLQLRHAHDPPPLSPWPVRCPDDIYDLDLRAEIWRYDPEPAAWTRVHVSPWVEKPEGPVPREIGYRGLVSFKGPGDRSPQLYVATWSPGRGDGALVLRGDGGHFEPVCDPGLGISSCRTLRALTTCDGRLFTSPMGIAGGHANVAQLPVVLEAEDPASGRWVTVSDPGFGDPDNLGIVELCEFAGSLYAGTMNPRTGFQLWKGDVSGPRPYCWRKVLGAGAYRGATNEAALSLVPFGDALYVGTGIQGGGFDRAHGVGPAAAEVVRVFDDDRWELLVGAERPTPSGHATPASGLGPGFGNFFAGYVWRMCEHAGALYAATWDWSVFLPYVPHRRLPEWFRRLVDRVGQDELLRQEGGADLWRSEDGVHWTPVTRTGFDNAFNVGIRTLASTPRGLFVGTANPFAPEIATPTEEGWRYVPNPRGGLEVWHELDGADGSSEPLADRDRSAALVSRRRRRRSVVVLGREAPTAGAGEAWSWPRGYWTPRTPDEPSAIRALVERLVDLLPSCGETVLDPACDPDTARCLAEHWPAAGIAAVCASESMLETCSALLPGATLRQGDPGTIPFPDSSFASVICAEPPARFDTRADFVAECARVLVPGGSLALVDLLVSPAGAHLAGARANVIRSPDDYRELYRRRGFAEIELMDVTQECWRGYVRHRMRTLTADAHAARIAVPNAARHERSLSAMSGFGLHAMLVAAQM